MCIMPRQLYFVLVQIIAFLLGKEGEQMQDKYLFLA